VYDSGAMLAEFIEGSLKLYARILHLLNVEWTIKQKIHEDNWKMFVKDRCEDQVVCRIVLLNIPALFYKGTEHMSKGRRPMLFSPENI
jgi:hypothetical protein